MGFGKRVVMCIVKCFWMHVAQYLKTSHQKCFSCGKFDICHYSVEEVPYGSIAESWVTRRHRAQIKIFTRLRAMSGGGFVARKFRKYNRGGVRKNICCVPNR